MALPDWLIKATGAMKFANNPANNFQPTIGDALQGIGHSMMTHYRRGQEGQAGSAAQQPAVPAVPAVPPVQIAAPPSPFGPQALRPLDQVNFGSPIAHIADLFR